MHGRQYVRGCGKRQEFTTLFRNPKGFSQERLCRGGAKAYDDLGMYQGHFGIEPLPASRYFNRVRLFVNPTLPSRLPLEVFNRVGHVSLLAIDSGLDECFIENGAGRPHEGSAFDVFLVAGLLADEHYFSVGRPLTKYRLRCMPP